MQSEAPNTSDPKWVVPLSDVLVEDDFLRAAHEALASGWWSMGPRVEAFEDEFSTFCDCEDAIAVANGTAPA